jgi:hypothetical protein
MKREMGLVLLAFGIFLTVYVVNAPDSFSSGTASAFAEAPTIWSLFLLMAAAASTLLGALMSARVPVKKKNIIIKL